MPERRRAMNVSTQVTKGWVTTPFETNGAPFQTVRTFRNAIAEFLLRIFIATCRLRPDPASNDCLLTSSESESRRQGLKKRRIASHPTPKSKGSAWGPRCSVITVTSRLRLVALTLPGLVAAHSNQPQQSGTEQQCSGRHRDGADNDDFKVGLIPVSCKIEAIRKR